MNALNVHFTLILKKQNIIRNFSHITHSSFFIYYYILNYNTHKIIHVISWNGAILIMLFLYSILVSSSILEYISHMQYARQTTNVFIHFTLQTFRKYYLVINILEYFSIKGIVETYLEACSNRYIIDDIDISFVDILFSRYYVIMTKIFDETNLILKG